jgi:hypothetical protein
MLAVYVRATASSLAAADMGELLDGKFGFPPVPVTQ